MRTLLALFLAAALAQPALAQLMGATELKVAVSIKGAPSTKPVADVYYLVGESGAKETYTLTAKGPASLTLFGPDGSEILTASGSGSVSLDVVLPFTDVFTIAVARKATAAPYSLKRKATVPTFTEAQLAGGIGYESKDGKRSQCWIIPGVKARVTYPNGKEEFTLAADRNTITFVSFTQKGTSSGEASYASNENMVRRTARYPNGKVSEASYDPRYAYDPKDDGRFTGYRCEQ
jgi:hypothetical protein